MIITIIKMIFTIVAVLVGLSFVGTIVAFMWMVATGLLFNNEKETESEKNDGDF